MEGRIYRQPLQKVGRVQYQLLRAPGCVHFYAAADGDMGFPSISTMGKVTSSSPATRGSKLFSPLINMNGSYHVVKKQDVSPSTNVDGDGRYYGTKEQDVPPATMDNGIYSDVSRDVSSSAKADGGGSGAKEGTKVDGSRSVQYQLLTASSTSSGYRQEDVSPPTISDGDQHGAKEEGEE